MLYVQFKFWKNSIVMGELQVKENKGNKEKKTKAKTVDIKATNRFPLWTERCLGNEFIKRRHPCFSQI